MKEGILITGATSDIGYEFLKNFKDKNKVIIAFYYDFEERLDDLVKNYGLNIIKIKYNFLELNDLKIILEENLKDIFVSKVLHLSAPTVKQERFNKIGMEQYKIDFSIQVLSIIEYALEGLMKSLVAEYSSFGIQINGISPSMIKSKFLNTMDERLIEIEIEKHPMKRTIEIKEIIETIDYLFESKNQFLTGNNLLLTGGENY